MVILPAIDIYGGRAVRLFKGDYEQMTVYRDDPLEAALEFEAAGAEAFHVVDLEGAKTGETSNIGTVKRLFENTKLFGEIGGGIRSMQTAEKYINAGASRIILGTAAVTDPGFLKEAVREFGNKVAVGADFKDGFVAIKGWLEKTEETAMEFCLKMQDLGVRTMICTDISRDGAMQGANHALYNELSAKLDIELIASGGVSSMEDIKRLKDSGMHGAIIGKAYYTGAIDLKEAIEAAK